MRGPSTVSLIDVGADETVIVIDELDDAVKIDEVDEAVNARG